MNNNDILFASIMGVKISKNLENYNLLQNQLSKHVLPPIPFLPFQNEITFRTADFEDVIEKYRADKIKDYWKADSPLSEDQQFFPLSFAFAENGQKWLFPYEPIINISSGNTIVKRNVARQSEKTQGTIKERFSRNDFQIKITGVLIGENMTGKPEDCFPAKQMTDLFEFLKHSKDIFVYCHPLERLGITRLVIEDYSFPFTKGENVQAYEINAISDFDYNLFIELEKQKTD